MENSSDILFDNNSNSHLNGGRKSILNKTLFISFFYGSTIYLEENHCDNHRIAFVVCTEREKSIIAKLSRSKEDTPRIMSHQQ